VQDEGPGAERYSDMYAARRAAMVARDLEARGIRDPSVLEAFRTVPRERFVPAETVDFAYDDTPLPIGEGQTISQPHMVAVMVAAAQLSAEDRVLEVGTGSGYAAAVLSRVSGRVWTIERLAALADQASRRLADLGYDNVHVITGDGSLGWPAAAPYDAIVVAAAARSVPPALLAQLGDGGRLLIPVARFFGVQELIRIRRDGDRFTEAALAAVSFVPLVSDQPSSLRRAGRPR
jgi:protein-L-isoaspartate(D-aspartate) O-methyltransferase